MCILYMVHIISFWNDDFFDEKYNDTYMSNRVWYQKYMDDTYFTCRNTHTMCTNCRYYGEKTISPSAIRISSNTAAKEAERKKFLKNGYICVCVYIYVIFKILLFLLSYESI